MKKVKYTIIYNTIQNGQSANVSVVTQKLSETNPDIFVSDKTKAKKALVTNSIIALKDMGYLEEIRGRWYKPDHTQKA
jgi:hypothetical protein|tara:strand:+ start:982 stop:1215 length:234 start_codon:yes stop_codon:yes gene_type:complete